MGTWTWMGTQTWIGQTWGHGDVDMGRDRRTDKDGDRDGDTRARTGTDTDMDWDRHRWPQGHGDMDGNRYGDTGTWTWLGRDTGGHTDMAGDRRMDTDGDNHRWPHGHGWGHACVTTVTRVGTNRGTHGHPTWMGTLGDSKVGTQGSPWGCQAQLGAPKICPQDVPKVATVTQMARNPRMGHQTLGTAEWGHGDHPKGCQAMLAGSQHMSPRCPQVSPDLRRGPGAGRAGRAWSCCGRTCCRTRPGRGRPRAPWWTPPPAGTRDTVTPRCPLAWHTTGAQGMSP